MALFEAFVHLHERKKKKKGKIKNKTTNIKSLHFPSVIKSSQCKNRYTSNPPSLFVADIYKNSWHKEKKIKQSGHF